MVSCPGCGFHIPAEVDLVARYFEEPKAWPCPNPECGEGVDWFEAVALSIKEDFFFVQGAMLLGAKQALFTIDAVDQERIDIDLTTVGVPQGATVVGVNCTPYSLLRATDAAWNLPDKFRNPFKLNLISVWVGDPAVAAAERSGKFVFLVTWIKPDDANGGWLHLVDSFRRYSAGRYDASIIPANTAVEMMLTPLLTNVLERFCAKEKATQFLTTDATYSHQLNVILPILCAIYKVPALPDNIRGQLNRLRKIRNEIAHEGHPENPLDEKDASRLLAAAFFGVHYVQIASSKFFAAP